jgi:hypothetical protein
LRFGSGELVAGAAALAEWMKQPTNAWRQACAPLTVRQLALPISSRWLVETTTDVVPDMPMDPI